MARGIVHATDGMTGGSLTLPAQRGARSASAPGTSRSYMMIAHARIDGDVRSSGGIRKMTGRIEQPVI